MYHRYYLFLVIDDDNNSDYCYYTVSHKKGATFYYAASLKAFSDSAYYDRCYCSVSVSPSVTFAHPAKAVGRNEMSFGREIHVVQSNIVLERGPDPPPEEEIWSRNPLSKFALQIAAKPLQIAEGYYRDCL